MTFFHSLFQQSPAAALFLSLGLGYLIGNIKIGQFQLGGTAGTLVAALVVSQAGGTWSDETDALGKKPGVMGAMTDDAAGNVWFAFSNKVVEWDGLAFHRFSFPDGKRGVSENTMSVRGDHVWLAGAGGGRGVGGQ